MAPFSKYVLRKLINLSRLQWKHSELTENVVCSWRRSQTTGGQCRLPGQDRYGLSRESLLRGVLVRNLTLGRDSRAHLTREGHKDSSVVTRSELPWEKLSLPVCKQAALIKLSGL